MPVLPDYSKKQTPGGLPPSSGLMPKPAPAGSPVMPTIKGAGGPAPSAGIMPKPTAGSDAYGTRVPPAAKVKALKAKVLKRNSKVPPKVPPKLGGNRGDYDLTREYTKPDGTTGIAY